MRRSMFQQKKLLAALFVAAATTAAAPAMAAQHAEHVRGTISRVTSNGFTVHTSSGNRTIKFDADTHIVGVVKANRSQIKSGAFIGTANVKQDGHYRAMEVVVFPPSMKGTGLGDYPWDLSAGGASGHSMMTNGSVQGRRSGAASGGSMMTNGTVKSRQSGGNGGHSMMTNGTVKHAGHSGELTLRVNYGKGSKTIVVPNGVPIVMFKPADKSALAKGAHVFVAGKPGHPVHASMVAVGLHGTKPPM